MCCRTLAERIRDTLEQRHNILLQFVNEVFVGNCLDPRQEEEIASFRNRLDLVDVGEFEVVEEVHHFSDHFGIIAFA